MRIDLSARLSIFGAPGNARCAHAGANAVDLLLNSLANPTPPLESHVITGELIIRGSTGPAPAAGTPHGSRS